MHRILYRFVICIAGVAGGLTHLSAAPGPREVGWVENVLVLPEKLTLKAKLDTGAATTSIDASDITRFEQHGRPWVRFAITDQRGHAAVLERPVVRTVKVKRSGLEDEDRPVVLLALCLGGEFRDVAVTLSDRSNLLYTLLIGRSAMAGRFLVNSSRKFTAKQGCVPGHSGR